MKLIKKSENEFVLIDKNGQQVDFQLDIKHIKNLLGEVDVEKKILDLYNQFPLHPMEKMYPLQGATKRFIEFVYNQAIEDNKDKKYTEEDMLNAFREGTNAGALHERLSDYDNGDYEDAEEYSDHCEQSFIKSIQHKTSWEVEFDDRNELRLAKSEVKKQIPNF